MRHTSFAKKTHLFNFISTFSLHAFSQNKKSSTRHKSKPRQTFFKMGCNGSKDVKKSEPVAEQQETTQAEVRAEKAAEVRAEKAESTDTGVSHIPEKMPSRHASASFDDDSE